MTRIKYIQHVNIRDPITEEVVEVQLFQLETGALVGFDKRVMYEADNLFNPYGITEQGETLEEVDEFDDSGDLMTNDHVEPFCLEQSLAANGEESLDESLRLDDTLEAQMEGPPEVEA